MTGIEVAAVRAAAGASVPVARGLYRRWRPKSDWASLAGLADGLAAAVDQAEQEVQQELRAGPSAFMPVRFTAAAHQQLEGGIDSAEIDEIPTYFDLLDQPRRMAILGEPGAGKTVAATYLVRGLIQRRSELVSAPRRAAEPVPVRVNTAGWDGGQEFSSWLATRLEVDYELPSKIAAKMIRAGMILPVLDGLDEMDDDTTNGDRARALLDRLNEHDWADRPAVVLCRHSEFHHLAQAGGDNGLHGAATVTLDPLATDQPADYLTRYQHRIGATHRAWDLITTHLREHTATPLAATLRNPWMLGLTATTLHHTPQTAAALLDYPTSDAVRNGLFAAQIPGALAGTDDTEQFRDYTPDNVERWLRTLARHLDHRRGNGRNGTSIRLDEVWEIAGINLIRILHILAVALLCGLASGLVSGLAFGLEAGLGAGSFATTFGVVLGLFLWIMRFPSASHIAWKVPTRRRWPAGLISGLLSGLTFGIMVGLEAGLGAGLGAGLAIGIIFGIGSGLTATTRDQLAIGTDARWLIRNDLRAALFSGALFGLGIGLTFGLASRLLLGLMIGSLAGLFYVLVFGLVSGRFFLSALVFKITGALPGRPAAFLDWARDSGLLRVNATAYQFRHQTYQQWLLHDPGIVGDLPRHHS